MFRTKNRSKGFWKCPVSCVSFCHAQLSLKYGGLFLFSPRYLCFASPTTNPTRLSKNMMRDNQHMRMIECTKNAIHHNKSGWMGSLGLPHFRTRHSTSKHTSAQLPSLRHFGLHLQLVCTSNIARRWAIRLWLTRGWIME